MSRKKILVVTPRFPFPVIGGDRLRIYQICKELSRFNDITLVSLCSAGEMNIPVQGDNVFKDVHKISHSRLKSLFRTVLAILTRKPLQIAYYQSGALRDYVERHSADYDVVIAHLIRSAQYLSASKAKSNILELTDAISLNYSRMTRDLAVKGIKYYAFSVEKTRLRDYEISAMRSSDASVLISDVDRSYLESYSDTLGRVVVSGNGIDLENYQYAFSPISKTLVFIGSMDFLPNLDGALWFAKQVMPELVKVDNFRFRVIGRISPTNVKKFECFPYVDVIGEVESVSEAAKGALLGVCSVRIGAGVQNKVLEYMGMSLPAVISTVASEGIGAEDNTHCVIADSIEDYISAILKLSSDESFAGYLSLSGRKFVEDNFSWQSKLKPYVELIDSLPLA